MSFEDGYLPRPGEFDPLATDVTNADGGSSTGANADIPSDLASTVRRPLLQFFTPSELRAYEPPPGQNMLGDYHLQRGAISVLAGPPGCGKSRAALSLAIAGARGAGCWLGLEVRSSFRTLILQNENGLPRLHRDVLEIPVEGLDNRVRISGPPPLGLALSNLEFREQLKAAVRDFQPDLVIVDPWNACVRDAMERDFQEGLARLREVLAESPSQPACLILHHLRKPKSDDRHKGRNLQYLLSGSYVLASVPRCIIIMQPASDDPEDARVVMTCAKNNDGELGGQTAWMRCASGFEPVPNFNFDDFNSGNAKREPKVKEEHLRELFENGNRWLALKRAAEKLQEIADVGRSAAYEALKLKDGRFSHLLVRSADNESISVRLLEERAERE